MTKLPIDTKPPCSFGEWHANQTLGVSKEMRRRPVRNDKARWQPFRASGPRRRGVSPSAETWRPTFGAAAAGLGLACLGLFQGVERFPEYLAPVVALTSISEVVGPVTRVRDADTIEVAKVPIRFGSLDCAERDTVAGQRATARLRSLISGQELHCYLNGRSSYDRKIGSCRLEDGRDLAAVMISEGYCGRFW